MEAVSTWKAVKPVVKALTPYAKKKLLGTELDINLSKVVDRAWESAVRAMCATAQPTREIRELEELDVVLGRALRTQGTAKALVMSVMDPSRPFGWDEHPEAGAILDDVDPATVAVDPRGLWDAFMATLRYEVVDAAGTGGLFELTVVSELEDIRIRSKGISAGVEQLLEAGKRATRQRRPDPPPYLATVGALLRSTPELINRDSEIEELMGFASGAGGYRWLIGGPWAGKTAVAAHLTTALGHDVDWVAYFLVRRLGEADSTQFLRVVNHQLAHLLGEDPPTPLDDPHAFRQLWERAVTEALAQKRHLLLIVDGLDEDVSRAKGIPSVASLLPTLTGSFAHVLVTSRPHPEVPRDVSLEHPLRRTHRHSLEPSPQATGLRERAEQELEAVLAPPGPDDPETGQARDVLRLLAAATGPLAVNDLAALSAKPTLVLQQVVDRQLSRVVQAIGPADAKRYVFAHETLLEASEAHFREYEGLDAAREEIIQWAERWRQIGWPIKETPAYLLDSYPGMLATYAAGGLLLLLGEFPFIEAAVARVGVDRAVGIMGMGARDGTATAPSRLARLMVREAHHLRDPGLICRPGYTSQQLCLAALAASDVELAEEARRRIELLPGPHLLARWTTARSSLALERTLTGHTSIVISVAVTPDGTKIVSGSWDGTIRVWDVVTGELLGEPLSWDSGEVTSLAVTPDGTKIVSGGSDKTIRVWDLATGAPVGEPLAGHTSWVTSVAVTPDGTRIVSGSHDNTVRVWDLVTGAPVGQPLTGHTSSMNSVTVTPDGTKIVSGSSDTTIRVWDLATGAPVGEPLTGHSGWVMSLAVTPDGTKIVSGGGSDGTIRVWDLATGAPVGEPLTGHSAWVMCLAVTPDGTKIVSGGSDGIIWVWDLVTGTRVGEPLIGHNLMVQSLAVTPDGSRIVSGGFDCNILLWDLATGTLLDQSLTDHRVSVFSIAVSPDGTKIVSGGFDNAIHVWDLATGTRAGQPLTPAIVVHSLTVTPDSTKIVSGGFENAIRVWDLVKGTPVGEPLTGHTGLVSSVAVSPDGTKIVSGSNDTTIRVWDLATGAPVGEPLAGHTAVNSVAVSPDSTKIVSGGSDGTIRVWDLVTGDPVGEPLTGHTGLVKSVVVTPDGTKIVSGSWDGTIRVWDLVTGDPVGEPLTGHSGWVMSLAVTPDGTMIVSGSNDTTIRVWDLATGRFLLQFACSGVVGAVAAHAEGDGCMLFAGNSAGSVIAWRLTAF
jgi:WD40 repeat protein